MDELNQTNESAVEEVSAAESEKALNCDSCGPKKTKTPAMFKAGIALMCATSALSLGAIGACGFLGYKLYKNTKNNNESNPKDSMQEPVSSKEDLTIEISDDGYWVIDGVKTSTKAEGVNGSNGVNGVDGLSVTNAYVHKEDNWGITTRIIFKLSDGTLVLTDPETNVMNDHYYEASSLSDLMQLAHDYKVPKIKLTADINLNTSIEFSGDVVINLNRKSLSYSASAPLKLAEESTLTFKNGSLDFQNNVGVSVEGADSELTFEKVNISASAVVAETLENNATINLENSSFVTVQPMARRFALRRASVGSLFVVKGENANLVVKGSKFDTNRAIISASENAQTINFVAKESKISTTAPILDIDTTEVVPTVDLDEDTLNVSSISQLNTSPITSGTFSVDPSELGAELEGVESFNVNGSSILASDFAALIEMVESGSTINLTKNLVLEEGILIEKELTLNLGNYKISAPKFTSYALFKVNGVGSKLTINASMRGGINSASSESDGSTAVWARNGGQVIINGGFFTNVGAKFADENDDSFNNELIYVSDTTGDGSKVIINGGSFKGNTANVGANGTTGNGTTFTLNSHDTSVGTIIVNGGYFYGFNPAETPSEPKNKETGRLVNFIGEGKICVGVDGQMMGEDAMIYIVDSSDLFAESLTKGYPFSFEEDTYSMPIDYIYLNDDIVLDETIAIETIHNATQSISINLGNHTITTTKKIAAFELYTGEIFVDNGTIDAYYDAFGVYGSNYSVTLTLGSDLNVISETGNCVYIKGSGASLVTSANLKAESDYAAIQGNGNDGSELDSITVLCGTVEGGDAAIYMPNSGNLVISGGELKGKNAVYIKSGNVVISGGKFIATGTHANYLFNGSGWNPTGDALVIDACAYPGRNPFVTITGGTFEVADKNAHGIAYYSYNGEVATIEAEGYTVFEQTIVTTAEALENAIANTMVSNILVSGNIVLSRGIVVTREITMNLNNCTITAPTFADYALFKVDTNGKLTINGEGTINSASSVSTGSTALWARNGGEIIVNGGTYTNNGAKWSDESDDSFNNELIYVSDTVNGGSIVTINGGTFIGNDANVGTNNTGNKTTFTLNSHDTSVGTIIVKGGSFYKYNPAISITEPIDNENPYPANFLAEGYLVYSVGDYFTVAPVTDLVEIINNNAGATIMLPTAYVVDTELTIDLNGCTLSIPTDTVGDGVFHVVAGGNLTINGEGIVNGLGRNIYSMSVWVDENGKATINGGTFTNLGAYSETDGAHFDLMYVKGGELVINGGTFIDETPQWTLNHNDNYLKSGKITVNGGSFYKYNPAESDTEPEDDSGVKLVNFVAEGYKVETNGDYYVVVEDSTQA